MNRSLVSINILFFRPGAYLVPCLASVLEQNYDNLEILVIDNASGDGTAQAARDFLNNSGTKINWRVLENQKNLGFAAGHNLGIKESRGEFVVLVNQDAILDRSFVANILPVFTDEKIGGAQGKMLRLKTAGKNFLKTDIVDTTGLLMLKNRRILARGQGQKDEGQFEKQEEIFGADGSLPVYRRAALEEVKVVFGKTEEYFDEDFVAYKEDIDLAWRLRLFGWRAVYRPDALAWHARTSGDSARTDYWGIIQERRKINQFGKFQSFKNQRLMQIKNEEWDLLFWHLPRFLIKEIGAWLYVMLFEHYTWKAIKELFLLAPRAWQKRKIIMARKKVSAGELKKWFV